MPAAFLALSCLAAGLAVLSCFIAELVALNFFKIGCTSLASRVSIAAGTSTSAPCSLDAFAAGCAGAGREGGFRLTLFFFASSYSRYSAPAKVNSHANKMRLYVRSLTNCLVGLNIASSRLSSVQFRKLDLPCLDLLSQGLGFKLWCLRRHCDDVRERSA